MSVYLQTADALAEYIANCLNDNRVILVPGTQIIVSLKDKRFEVLPSPSGWCARELKDK